MVEFDFEKDVERILPKMTEDTIHSEIGSFKVGDQKHRVVVCRHWLLGLCFNGANCSYLHKLDKNRMPTCKHGKLCKIKNCLLKHIADEELEECGFYRQGFCPNGPKCGRRHMKRTPEECPQESAFESGLSANTHHNQLLAGAAGSKRLKPSQPNENFKVTLCTHWLLNNSCPFGTDCHYAHGEDDINEGYQPNADFLNDLDIYDPHRNRMEPSLELPVAQSSRCSFFILQAPDLRSLTISRRRHVWAVPNRMSGEMNAALRSSDHVLIYFCVRPLRGVYGVALMSGPIPSNPAAANGALSAEFPVHWLRTMRFSLRTVAQLKLGSSGMFVGRSSTDGRFENRAGLDMLFTAYRKPAWDWSQQIELAEANIRLSDTGHGGGISFGEYYPAARAVPYFLPPDVLFAQDWVDRAGLAVNDKGVLMATVGSYGRQSAVHTDPMAALEVYAGNQPAFVVCGVPAEIEEMLGRLLCGLPLDFKDSADALVAVNMPVFLFDVQMQVMLGLFYATSKPVLNMDPSAFARGGKGPSALPLQFGIRPAFDCPPVPVPIRDPELYSALGEHAQTLGQIGLPHTKALVKLFARKARIAFPGVGPYKGPGQQQGAGAGAGPRRVPIAPGGGIGIGPGGSNTVYRPPFRHVTVVKVDIPGHLYDVKRRLLGPNASSLMAIVDAVGSKQTLRIRMRGIGSGFYEGAGGQELQEPLHFNVSAESEELLQAAVARLSEHIAKVRGGG